MPPINTRLTKPVQTLNHPEPAPVQARGGPSLPPDAPQISSTLRTPLPNIVAPSPDNLRQFYAGGIPKYRFTPPLPLATNSSSVVKPTSSSLGTTLTTSASTTDTISLVGVSSASTVSLTPTNAIAAAMTGVYVSAKNKNSITITHPATAGGTFDVIITNS